MTVVKVEFPIYMTPKSMNAGGGGSRTHWASAHKDKRMWEQAIMAELLCLRVRRGAESVVAHVTLNWKRRGRRDVTNYYPSVIKPLADALVKFGLLVDDTDEFFRVGTFNAQIVTDWPKAGYRLQGYVLVELEATYP